MMGLAGVGVAYAAQQREARDVELSREGQPAEVATDLSKPSGESAPPPARVVASEQRLGEGRTLVGALRALGLAQDAASRVVTALGTQLDPRLMRPTDLVRVERAEGDDAGFQRVIYRRSESRAWMVAPGESGELVATVAPAATSDDTAAADTDSSTTVPGLTLAGLIPGLELDPLAPSSGGSSAGGRGGSGTSAPTAAQGFNHGQPMSLSVVVVDGKPVEMSTARAFERMREAARRDGVWIQIVSGFRTMDQQRNLYALYRSGHGNLAAVPGFSNHQSGHALDLNTSSRGVYAWLQSHGSEYGFRRTVPSEAWHWEHW